MKQESKKIQDILNYSSLFLNTPYVLWHPDIQEDYFYCDNKLSVEQIKLKGLNCAGFINLARQYSGLPIPPLKQSYETNVRGGTVFWSKYFQEQQLTEYFDYTKNYPIGTLLLRKYRSQQDQGHLAIVYKKNEQYPEKMLFCQIIHCYDMDDGGGKVGVDPLGYCQFWRYEDKYGYYQYAVKPENWLKL